MSSVEIEAVLHAAFPTATTAQVAKAWESVLLRMQQALIGQRDVVLLGVAVLSPYVKAKTSYRCPKTGAIRTVPACRHVKMSISRGLLDAVRDESTVAKGQIDESDRRDKAVAEKAKEAAKAQVSVLEKDLERLRDSEHADLSPRQRQARRRSVLATVEKYCRTCRRAEVTPKQSLCLLAQPATKQAVRLKQRSVVKVRRNDAN